jgi:hypothetical protein
LNSEITVVALFSIALTTPEGPPESRMVVCTCPSARGAHSAQKAMTSSASNSDSPFVFTMSRSHSD